jgi:hypothetical protein
MTASRKKAAILVPKPTFPHSHGAWTAQKIPLPDSCAAMLVVLKVAIRALLGSKLPKKSESLAAIFTA